MNADKRRELIIRKPRAKNLIVKIITLPLNSVADQYCPNSCSSVQSAGPVAPADGTGVSKKSFDFVISAKLTNSISLCPLRESTRVHPRNPCPKKVLF